VGYDFHITRASDWTHNTRYEISAAEWLGYIRTDPELTPDPENGPHAVVWSARHEGEEVAWLDWCSGNVYTTNPDRARLRKMLEIARALGGWVQGDRGEVYESVADFDEHAFETGRRP